MHFVITLPIIHTVAILWDADVDTVTKLMWILLVDKSLKYLYRQQLRQKVLIKANTKYS